MGACCSAADSGSFAVGVFEGSVVLVEVVVVVELLVVALVDSALLDVVGVALLVSRSPDLSSAEQEVTVRVMANRIGNSFFI